MVENMVTIAKQWLVMVTMDKSMVNHGQPQSSFRRGMLSQVDCHTLEI